MGRFWNRRAVGAFGVAVGLTVGGAGRLPGAQPDPLSGAKASQQLAEQKAKSHIDGVLSDAGAQARSNPTKAVANLKSAKQELQFALGISDDLRTRLTADLDAKIAELEGRPVGRNPRPVPGANDPKNPEVIAAQKAAAEKAAAEFKDVVAGIKKVQTAYDANRPAEAAAETARLTRLYPSNPSVMALTQNGSIKTKLDDAIAFQVEYRNRWVANQKNIMMSSLPAIRDVEFPADWVEKSKRRLKTVEMSAKEKKIVEALDKSITVNFRDRPFEEALQDLSNQLDQPLLIDKASVADLEIDLKKGSTLEANGLSGRTVLRSLLAAHGLTFVVKEETIQIVTVERARGLLTTRVYYLGDLIRGTGLFGGPEWGPYLNAEQTGENAKSIAAMIQKSIDPLSWRDNGGAGSVTFDPLTMSIVVRSSAEVHFTLSRAFNGR